MFYFVYILKSLKDSGYYVGMSADIKKRLAYHNAGRVQSTKHRRPFEAVYTEEHSSRKAAREREKYLKSYKGSKKNWPFLKTYIAGSSNGRTLGFGPRYQGSNPCPPANLKSHHLLLYQQIPKHLKNTGYYGYWNYCILIS